MTIVSPSLGEHALLTVTYDAHAVVWAPEAWSIVPGTLHAEFNPALKATTADEPGLRVTLAYPHSYAPQIAAGNALAVLVDYGDGHSLRWVALSVVDPAHDRLTTCLPASLLSGAAGVTLAIGVDNIKHAMESPGPRYWDGKNWSKTGTIVANESTVVLIHGIFSSVETAFPTPSPKSTETPCPSRIASAGGFQQVLGFDYAWNEPPDTEGKLFAAFLNQIAADGVTSLSIEAHSYGSVVTLAAVPDSTSTLKIGNVVTLGGPLPLRGTPLANPDNDWRMGMFLGLLDWYFKEPPSVVTTAFKSGMVASLATDSSALKAILKGVDGMPTKPKFVEVAGTKWICFAYVFGACVVDETQFKPQLVDGSGVELPWDGVVETIAANSTALPSPVPTTFPLSHIELECTDSVINWVGKQIKGS